MYRGWRGRARRGVVPYFQRDENRPPTELARKVLVTSEIKKVEQIYYSAQPVKDDRIADALLSWQLKDTVRLSFILIQYKQTLTIK